MIDMRKFDLNLLLIFDALMEEKSVSKAAVRIGIGQPAMSHALKRLRDAFGDDLFVRADGQMHPTARAVELAPDIKRILKDVRTSVLSSRPFNPDSDTREFRIAATDYCEAAIMPALFASSQSEAPNIRIIIVELQSGTHQSALESGEVDLALGFFPQIDARLSSHPLYVETFECLYDPSQCDISLPMTAEAYSAIPHVMVSVKGEANSIFDELLTSTNHRRTVKYVTNHFLTIPLLLHGKRLLATVPSRLAQNCANVTGLTICNPPFPSPEFEVAMLWHSQSSKDDGHIWLRQQIKSACNKTGEFNT